jgi:hypothetical protein
MRWSELASQAAQRANVANSGVRSGEALYRMVVDAKVAEQLGQGLVKPMASKAVAGGIRGGLRGQGKGIVSQASFVPALEGGAAVTAGALAGPLILMGLAVGMTAYAEYQQQQQLKRIEALLDEQKQASLNDERYALESAMDALRKTSAVLLDKGEVGNTIGIGSADAEIGKAIARARDRTRLWSNALDGFADRPVELPKLIKKFEGIHKPSGEFYTHLELAMLATTLRRRLGMVQALDHAGLNPNNSLERFLNQLALEDYETQELADKITAIRSRLSTLSLRCRPGAPLNPGVFRPRDVNRYLATSELLRKLEPRESVLGRPTAVSIEMARTTDGCVTVFPAAAELW